MRFLKVSLTLIAFVFIAKGTGYIVERINAHYPQDSQTSLYEFLNESIVQNPKASYPTKISEQLLLWGIDLTQDDNGIILIYEYQILSTLPEMGLNKPELKAELRQRFVQYFCSEVQNRENLFRGFSDVASLSKFNNNQGDFMFQIHVDKSLC